MQPRDGTERILQYNLIAFAILGLLSTTSWAEGRLFDPSKLKMFVDELPDMPKILGFDVVSGVPKSKSLKIGMFEKKWVRRLFHVYYFCRLCENYPCIYIEACLILFPPFLF